MILLPIPLPVIGAVTVAVAIPRTCRGIRIRLPIAQIARYPLDDEVRAKWDHVGEDVCTFGR
jgi:hypothetical protein